MDAMKAEHVDTLRDFVKLAREATSYIGMMADDDDEIVNLRERIGDAEYAIAALAQRVPADGEAPCVVCGFGRNGAQHSRADSYLDARGMYHDYTPQAPQPVVDASQPQQGAVEAVVEHTDHYAQAKNTCGLCAALHEAYALLNRPADGGK